MNENKEEEEDEEEEEDCESSPWIRQSDLVSISSTTDESSESCSLSSSADLLSTSYSNSSSANEANSPSSPSLSLISANTSDSFTSAHSTCLLHQKNVTAFPTLDQAHYDDYETIYELNTELNLNTCDLDYADLNHLNQNTVLLADQFKLANPKMKKIKIKAARSTAEKKTEIEGGKKKLMASISKKVDFRNSKEKAARSYDNEPVLLASSLMPIEVKTASVASASAQSSPKSSEMSHTPIGEDSSFSSNLSSSSNKSSTDKSSGQSKTVSSISSTSSGVSSNISSASSTTSETPYSSEAPHTSSQQQQQQQHYSANLKKNIKNCIANSIGLGCRSNNSSNNNSKMAPKAIISDDGDIGVEETANRGAAEPASNKPAKKLTFEQQQVLLHNNFYRDSKCGPTQRSSMRILQQQQQDTSFIRHANERHSHRVISSSNQYGQPAPVNNYQQNYQFHPQFQPQQQQVSIYQQLAKNQQDQMAAAAAAAAAVNLTFLWIFFLFKKVPSNCLINLVCLYI